MEKKILIAVDDSSNSRYAVAYAAEIYGRLIDVRFTLLHIQPILSQYLLDEANHNPKMMAKLKLVNKKNVENGQQLLATYQQRMVAAGIPAERIATRTQPCLHGVAKDIQESSLAGQFDALMLGRRGRSGLENLFMGSVSADVVSCAADTPIWLIDQGESLQNILVAVDGSSSSLKAVDHLAFMIAGSADVTITLLHVTPRLKDYCPVDFDADDASELEAIILKGDKACVDQFYAHAQKLLTSAGLDPNQLSMITAPGKLRVGKAVLDAFRRDRFDTLVIGRRGMNKKHFTGSVSRYLLNRFTHGALWIVP